MRPRTSSSASASSCAWARTSSALPKSIPTRRVERGEPLRPGRQAGDDGIDHRDRPARLSGRGAMKDLRDRPAGEGGEVVDRRQAQTVGGELRRHARRAAPARPIGRLLELGRPARVPVDGRQREVAGPIVGVGDHFGEASMEGAARLRIHVTEGDRSEQRMGAAHQHRVVEREQAAVDRIGESLADVRFGARRPQPLRARRAERGGGLHNVPDRRRGRREARRERAVQGLPRRCRQAVPVEVGRAGELEGVHRIAARRARGRARAPAAEIVVTTGVSTCRIASMGSTPSVSSSVRSGLNTARRAPSAVPVRSVATTQTGRSSRRRRA